jgi:hypothetical protein
MNGMKRSPLRPDSGYWMSNLGNVSWKSVLVQVMPSFPWRNPRGGTGTIYGVDISDTMEEITKKDVVRAGFEDSVVLVQG